MAKSQKRIQELNQVAAIATSTSLALRGGVGVVAALHLAVRNASGSIAEKVRLAVRAIELGESPDVALSATGPLEEFYSKLLSAQQLGSGVADQLDDFVESLLQDGASEQLRASHANETRMLIPLVFLILPVTVVFALYPSLQMLNQTM